MHYGRENPAKEESSDKNGATKTEPVKSGSRRGSNCSKRRRSRNDRNGRGHYTRERPGMSAFVLDEGIVHHTYSTYARGLDSLWGMYQWLDRAPKGRNETGVWWRRHDEYGK